MISGISNSDLSIQPSKNAVFSRRFACFVFQPYVSALVFALTSRNKGKFLFPADYLIQQPCGSTLRLPCSVSVYVHRGTYIGVSEKPFSPRYIQIFSNVAFSFI